MDIIFEYVLVTFMEYFNLVLSAIFKVKFQFKILIVILKLIKCFNSIQFKIYSQSFLYFNYYLTNFALFLMIIIITSNYFVTLTFLVSLFTKNHNLLIILIDYYDY